MNTMDKAKEITALMDYITHCGNCTIDESLATNLVARGLTLDIVSKAACNGLNLNLFIQHLQDGLDLDLFIKSFNYGLDCQGFNLALKSVCDNNLLNEIIDFSLRYDFEDAPGPIEFPANYFPTIACIRFSPTLARQRSLRN